MYCMLFLAVSTRLPDAGQGSPGAWCVCSCGLSVGRPVLLASADVCHLPCWATCLPSRDGAARHGPSCQVDPRLALLQPVPAPGGHVPSGCSDLRGHGRAVSPTRDGGGQALRLPLPPVALACPPLSQRQGELGKGVEHVMGLPVCPGSRQGAALVRGSGVL